MSERGIGLGEPAWACIADVQLKTRGKRGTVVVDGHDMSTAITRVDVVAQSGEMPAVVLHLALPSALFEGDAVVKLPDATVQALCALGWTAPDV